MDRTHRGTVLAFTVLGGLGGLACILQWLGIKPADLQMNVTLPHWLWLIFGLLLFGVSISLSVLSWRASRKTIAEAIAPEREETERVKAALYDSARSNLEYRGERDRCEEEKRMLQKRFDMFTPLQIEAMQLSVDLLKFLKRMGHEPMPKYTRDQIVGMPLAQQRALLDANDGDYAEACEYYSTDATWFLPRTWQDTKESKVNERVARWKRLFPWYQKIASGYALEMKDRVETLRHRFIVDGFDEEALSLPVEGRDGKTHIRAIANALWQLVYRSGEQRIRNETT